MVIALESSMGKDITTPIGFEISDGEDYLNMSVPTDSKPLNKDLSRYTPDLVS